MRGNIWNKKIPTLLGILFIALGVGVTSFLVKQGVIFVGRAAPSDVPQNIKVSNITESAFTVSYETSGEVLGSVNFGEGETPSLGKTALDEKDGKQGATARKVHSIIVENLSPSTTYFFSITSGQNTYLDNGLPFKASTGPILSSPATSQKEIKGNIIMPDGSIPAEAIIYIATENAQVLSSLVKTDGSYSLSLGKLRTKDLSSYFQTKEGTTFTMLVYSDVLSSSVTFSANQKNPLPTITLSQNYDFTISSLPISNEAQASSPSAAFPTVTPSVALSKTPQILTPKQDQGFSDQQPQFKGTALPNENVQIVIHSDAQIKTQIKADSNGNWNYRPDQSLSAGVHTISITTRDSFGILKTITQSFVVYAAGTQVAQSATPSATATPTPTITVTPTSTPTPTLTVTPTFTPTPTPTLLPTKTLAPTGSSSTAAAMLGVAVITIGALLFFLSRTGI